MGPPPASPPAPVVEHSRPVMSWQPSDLIFLSLRRGFQLSGLSIDELHADYAAHGGDMDWLELEACLLELCEMDEHDHNVAALALNEFYLGQPRCHLIPYQDSTAWQ